MPEQNNQQPSGEGNASLTAPRSPPATPPAGSNTVNNEIPPPAPKGDANAFNPSLPENWRESLPEDIKGEKSLEMYKDIGALAKSLVHAQKQVGRDKITIPDPKLATDEDYRAVFKKLGLPEDPKEYEVKLKKDSKLDPDFLNKFKENAHKAGILPRQAQAVLDWYETESEAHVQAVESQFNQKKTQQLTKLKEEWGNAFGKHIEAAQLAFGDFATEADVNYLNETGLDSDPVLLRLFSKIGMVLKDDDLKGRGHSSSIMSPADAQKQIDEIMANPDHPHNNGKHPNHQTAVAEMSKLWEQVHPKK